MISLTLACAFLACAQPLSTAPDDGPMLAPVAADIKLPYICGNAFRLRNNSSDTITVRYDVYGTSETGLVFLAGKPAGALYSETYFTTTNKGTVRVFLGTQLVQTKANGNKPACTLPSDTIRVPIPGGFVWPRGDSIPTVASTADTRARFYRRLVMIEVAPSMGGQTFNAILAKFGATVAGGFPEARLYVLTIPDPVSYDSLLSVVLRLRAEPGVVAALGAEFGSVADVPQGLYPYDGSRSTQASMRSTSPASPNWSRVAIRAPLGWGCETGSAARPIGVGVLDYLFDATDPDLDAVATTLVLPPQELAPALAGSSVNLSEPFNRSHGNGVAGVMAAKGGNGDGVAGLIWNRSLHLYPLADGNDVIYNFPVYLRSRVVPDLIANQVRLLVVSLTFGSGDPLVYPVIEAEIARYLASGGVLVLATDNVGGSKTQSELASLTLATAGLRRAAAVLYSQFPGQVWFISGTDKAGQIWSNSTRYVGLEALAAPAVDVLTLGRPMDWPGSPPDSAVRAPSGVSFAAPAVAGTAALLWSRDPSLTGAQVLELLQQGAARGRPNPFTGAWEMPQLLAGGVRQLDVYGSLQLQAESPGMPLCGNRLWTEGNAVFAERGSSNPEPIATLPHGAGFIFPFHGGRKLVAQDALTWDAYVFEQGQSGGWTQAGEWDGDDTELAGSGPAVFGYTHDRDSLGFVYGDRLYLGTRFLEFDRPFPLLPSRPNSQNGHAECIRKEKEGENWVCMSESFEGTTISYRWGPGAYPVGPRSIFLRNHVTSTESAISGVATDCATGGAPDENTTCLEWSGTSVETSLRSEVWRVDRVSEVAAHVTELAPDLEGRYVVSVTGSEDGGRLAVATEVYTQDPGGSVMGTDCRTDFYSYGTDGQLHKDATRAYAATCQPFDWQGGFGAARQLLTVTRSPSTRGFGLVARLLRATGR